jgi:hypothetical protein
MTRRQVKLEELVGDVARSEMGYPSLSFVTHSLPQVRFSGESTNSRRRRLRVS